MLNVVTLDLGKSPVSCLLPGMEVCEFVKLLKDYSANVSNGNIDTLAEESGLDKIVNDSKTILRIFYQNIRGLRTTDDEFFLLSHHLIKCLPLLKRFFNRNSL